MERDKDGNTFKPADKDYDFNNPFGLAEECVRTQFENKVMEGTSTNVGSGWDTDYYELPDGVTQLQDLIEYRDMNFQVGNIFKACYRLGQKEGTTREYDLNKIIWYAKRELNKSTPWEDE